MKPDAWMPLYIGDYKRDTGRLTRDQHGAYLLLIMEYWTTGPLCDDDAELAAIALAAPREWKVLRSKMLRFFTVSDGLWRHKRIDEELERWGERKRIFTERAAAGGRAKAAKSTAFSRPKASLEPCTVSPVSVEEAPKRASSHRGQNDFLGPQEVRDAFVTATNEGWVRSYIDPCAWQDVPERALIPASLTAANKIIREARKVLAELGLTVLERRATA